MRSAPGDLTTRARIRDAAIAAFARDGFDRASLRSIAADAGVSAALIVHHFGDKSGLRATCDDHVIAAFVDDQHDLVGAPAVRIRTALNDLDRYGPHVDYLARMLVDSGPAAGRLFDALIDGTERVLEEQRAAGLLEPMSDPEMSALLVAMLGLAPLVLRGQLSRRLGDDLLGPAGMRRMTLPTMELLTKGVYATDAFLEGARTALDGSGEERP